MNKRVRISHCGFCGVNLTAKNRAKEHVFRRSWLAGLGHSKLVVPGSLFSKENVVAVRNPVADQVLAGEVCKGCNNGWMNHLDLQVEHLLMLLITEHKQTVEMTVQEARRVARWLLKTAAAYELTDKPERRHIPTPLRRNLRRADWLPSGLWVFTCASSSPQKGLSIAILDAWPVQCTDVLLGMPQSQRLKFAVAFDNLLIGCCAYLGKSRPTFIGVEGLHHSVMTVGASIEFDSDPKTHQLMAESWNHPTLGGSPTNLALATIGIRFSPK